MGAGNATRTKHTPGPWVVGVTVDRADAHLLGWPVFRLRDLENPDPEGSEVQANANLIAAAPDMRVACELADEALRLCLRYFMDTGRQPEPEDLTDAQTALALALGKHPNPKKARAKLAKARGES